MMISTVVRSLLARSAFKNGHRYAFGSSATTSKSLSNLLLGQRRLFSVSTRVASPVATKTTTKKKTATKAAPKKKTTAAKKKTTVAAKKKTVVAKKKTTKKVVPKKRKVAAPKSRVTVTKRKVKKVAPVKVTPRNNASLRAPSRAISAYSLYVKRMWPTLSPKPTSAPEGMKHIRDMWKSLTAAEKQPFSDEALALSNERRAVYDKWRAGLSRSDVITINAYRANTKHSKLGGVPKTGDKKPAKGYMKFYQESLKDGTIDMSKAPADTRAIIYASKEAGRLWKAMSTAQKDTYK